MGWWQRLFRRDEPETVVNRSVGLGEGTLDRILKDRLFGEDYDFDLGDNAKYYGTSTAVFAAVRVLAEAVSRPPLQVFVNGDLAGDDHWFRDIVTYPSLNWTQAEMMRDVESSMQLFGSSFLVMEERGGIPYALRPMHSADVRVIIRNNRLVGFIEETGDRRGRRSFLPRQVVWFRRYNPENWADGYSALKPSRIGVEMGDEALRFNRRFYLTSALPSNTILEGYTGSEEELDKFLNEWTSRAYEPLLAHVPHVLRGGVTLNDLGRNQRDMEFIGALQWSVEEVSRSFGVPKAFLAEFEDATLTNIRTMEQFLWRNTVVPELRLIEGSFNRFLRLTRHGGDDRIEVRFDLSSIEALRETDVDRANYLATLVEAGIMTSDEARLELELEVS